MTPEFLDWIRKSMTPNTSAKDLVEMWSGWADSAAIGGLQMVRGISPYCNGYNAYTRFAQSKREQNEK